MNEYKACRICEKEFPKTDEYFCKRKDSKDGLRNECRQCAKKLQQIRQGKNGFKERRKKWDSKYYKNNREKILKKEEQYRKENKEKIDNINKEYRKNNHDKIVITNKKYRETHAEQVREKNRKWDANNKQRRAMISHNYRAKKRKLPRTLTIKQWMNIKIKFNNKCAYCGKEVELTQEHFIALNKGGEYTVNNIIPACGTCNSSKQDKNFFDWYTQQSFYNKEKEKFILKYLGYKENKQQLKLI